jgi:glycosyltransferase involved in cell wall biosynthesis
LILKVNKRKLKVVHISTYRSGGAGRAAFRIHEALLKNGVDSSFLTIEDLREDCLKKFSYYNQLPETLIKPPRFIERQKNRIRFRLRKHLNIVIKSKIDIEREGWINEIEERRVALKKYEQIDTPLHYENASLPFSVYDILQNPIVKQANIIHLHWVASMLDYPSFFANNSKPVVWTLHDMNPFQGLFHYKEDELRNRGLTRGLDEKTVLIKQRSIKQRKAKMKIVAPSSWLLKKARNSHILKNIASNYIPYPIDTRLFCPGNKKELRKIKEIPEKNIVLLFVSENINNYRKGFDLLIDAFKKLHNTRFTLIMLGAGENCIVSGIDIRNVGPVNDNKKIADYFSLADAFIIPSREDNLPNVMLESLACGTPVIGFPVGGIKEHVINFKTGVLADNITSESLAIAIDKFCTNREHFNSQVIRRYAEEKFNEQLIAGQYLKIYNRLFKKRKLHA